jgi:hypothetical protein
MRLWVVMEIFFSDYLSRSICGFPPNRAEYGASQVGKSEKFNPPYKFPKQQGLKFNSEFRFSIPIPTDNSTALTRFLQ